MPPADNTNTPAPAPAPEPAKKPGFFARLFGKKQDATPAVPPHESQTPQPQLDDTVSRDSATPADPTAPSVGVDVTAPSVTPAGSDSSSVPTVGADEEAKPIDVPSSVSAPGVDSPTGTVSPTLPTDPAAPGTPEAPAAPGEDPSAPKPL